MFHRTHTFRTLILLGELCAEAGYRDSHRSVQCKLVSPSPQTPSWEAALDLLRSRGWTQERVVTLWLHPCYVLGTHAVLAVGVSIHGPRRVLDLMESAPEDEGCIATFLEGLQARGVRADRGLLCTVASAIALQRCLCTKIEEVVGLLEPDEARRIRHRLRLAWMRSKPCRLPRTIFFA